jgi:lysophospholipase L1-like esterase
MLELRVFLLVALLLTAGSASPGPARKSAFLRQGDRVVFLGDSITERGIYTRYVESWVRALYPELEARFMNAGKGGETAAGGLARLEREVLVHSPTVVVICYGMNDAGRRSTVDPQRLESFIASQRELIRRIRAAGARPFLLTSPCAGEDRQSDLKGMNGALEAFAEALKKPGDVENVPVVDLFHAMLKQDAAYREHYPGQTLTGDGIHPGDAGNLLMAIELLRAWGLAD